MGNECCAKVPKREESLSKSILDSKYSSQRKLGDVLRYSLRKHSKDQLEQLLSIERPNMHQKLVKLYEMVLYGEPENQRRINLSFANLGKNGAKLLSFLLYYFPEIRGLMLWKSGLGDSGFKFLSFSMANAKNLETLSLESNHLSPNCCKYLNKVLFGLPNLKELWLQFNKIEDAGLEHLVEGLDSSKNLKVLALDDNCVSPQGISCVSCALLGLSQLEVLSFSSNNIDDEGALEVLGLIQGINLKKLVIGIQDYSQEVVNQYQETLTQCKLT
mmetsp:Transcript_14177/g.20728  ORF Transcript_14177/g.20728 Transcript_14177/m.20728 type:complete len:273 (+) Transcript_14177:24-842(+)